jgi:hypothetical protein
MGLPRFTLQNKGRGTETETNYYRTIRIMDKTTNAKEITEAVEELKNALIENVSAKKLEEEAKVASKASHYRKQKALELLMSLMRD